MAKKWGRLPYEIWDMPAWAFQEMLDHWEIEAYQMKGD